jgi:hypothetical protein
MLKEKFLHRHGRSYYDSYYNCESYCRHSKKFRNVDITDMPDYCQFDEIFNDFRAKPKRFYYKYSYIDTEPLYKFIESKIGCDWNEVYSEILTKTKKKYRNEIENTIKWAIKRPIYDENYIPRDTYGRILKNFIYINLENKIVRMSEDEILREANKYLRKDKMKKLLEAIKNEELNHSPLDL